MSEEVAKDLLVQVVFRPELILYVRPDGRFLHEPRDLVEDVRDREQDAVYL